MTSMLAQAACWNASVDLGLILKNKRCMHKNRSLAVDMKLQTFVLLNPDDHELVEIFYFDSEYTMHTESIPTNERYTHF